MKSVPIVLLLAVLAAGEGGTEAPPGLPPLTLPVAANGTPDKGEYPDGRTIIRVDAKGFVHWRGRKTTLDQLGAVLENLNEKYELKMRAEGKRGGKTSKLHVLLRADKETPWQQVQWLLAILAEQRIHKVQFAVSRVADRSYIREEAARLGAEWVDRAAPKKPQLEAKIDAFLLIDRRLAAMEAPEIQAAIHIMARQEIAAKWGPDGLPVLKPTVFKYRMGDRVCDTLEPLGKWIGDALRAAPFSAPGTRVVGEIKAGYKVPFKHVVAVLNQFHARGVKRVDFYGTPSVSEKERFWDTTIPGKELRKRAYLPYPIKNYPTRR